MKSWFPARIRFRMAPKLVSHELICSQVWMKRSHQHTIWSQNAQEAHLRVESTSKEASSWSLFFSTVAVGVVVHDERYDEVRVTPIEWRRVAELAAQDVAGGVPLVVKRVDNCVRALKPLAEVRVFRTLGGEDESAGAIEGCVGGVLAVADLLDEVEHLVLAFAGEELGPASNAPAGPGPDLDDGDTTVGPHGLNFGCGDRRAHV
mgnify:CR=1 FL=1